MNRFLTNAALAVALALLGAGRAAATGGTIFMPFARCSAEVAGTPVELDFFSERDGAFRPTGRGMALQTTRGTQGESRVLLWTSLAEGGPAGAAVTLYAMAEPTVVFAQFTIPAAEASTVEIFARGFGQTWGVFACRRVPGL